jgi:hypothetical protein
MTEASSSRAKASGNPPSRISGSPASCSSASGSRRSSRMQSRRHHVGAPATVRGRRADRRIAGARRRTGAPSPIRRQLREERDSPPRGRRRTPVGPIYRFRPRLAAPTRRFAPAARQPGADRASRTRIRGPPTRPSRAEAGQLPSWRQDISGCRHPGEPTGGSPGAGGGSEPDAVRDDHRRGGAQAHHGGDRYQPRQNGSRHPHSCLPST